MTRYAKPACVAARALLSAFYCLSASIILKPKMPLGQGFPTWGSPGGSRGLIKGVTEANVKIKMSLFSIREGEIIIKNTTNNKPNLKIPWDINQFIEALIWSLWYPQSDEIVYGILNRTQIYQFIFMRYSLWLDDKSSIRQHFSTKMLGHLNLWWKLRRTIDT